MQVNMEPSKLEGEWNAIISKSYAHRALICAALHQEVTFIRLNYISIDIQATIDGLVAMGAKIQKIDKDIYQIIPIPQDHTLEDIQIHCRECGSTLRFLVPVAASLGGEVTFLGEGRLPFRPMEPMIEILKEAGMQVSLPSTGSLPMKIVGKLNRLDCSIPGNISSQYITGLYLAGIRLKGNIQISIGDPIESLSYIHMTKEVMSAYGYDEWGRYVRPIPKNFSYEIPGDWSNAAFMIAANYLGGKIHIRGLDENSIQGDREIQRLADLFKSNQDIKIDISQIPDLVPVLCVMAGIRNKKTRLVNGHRLRLKESDRIESSIQMLCNIGGKAKAVGDDILIEGVSSYIGGKVDSYNDHRIVMASAIAVSASSAPIIIENAQAVEKSFPDFFEVLERLGGSYHVI